MFDPNEGDTHVVVVDYKLTGDSGKITFKQKKATIRKFQGECVEELLYTIDNFRDIIQDTGIAPDAYGIRKDSWSRTKETMESTTQD
jgi:hypothetical protein